MDEVGESAGHQLGEEPAVAEHLEVAIHDVLAPFADSLRRSMRDLPDMGTQHFLHQLLAVRAGYVEHEDGNNPVPIAIYALHMAEAERRWDEDPAPRYVFRRAAAKIGLGSPSGE